MNDIRRKTITNHAGLNSFKKIQDWNKVITWRSAELSQFQVKTYNLTHNLIYENTTLEHEKPTLEY